MEPGRNRAIWPSLSIKTSTFAKSSDFFFLLQDLLLGLEATGLQLEYVALSLEPGS